MKTAVLNRVRELHARGWHDSRIGRSIGVTARAAMVYRRRLGLSQNRYRMETAASRQDKKIRELHADGLLDTEIAERISVCRRQVTRRRKILGLKANDWKSRSRESNAFMQRVDQLALSWQLACQGATVDWIVEAIGVDRAEAAQIVSEMPKWWRAESNGQGLKTAQTFTLGRRKKFTAA